MELSSFQRITIQHQFDRFAKLVIAGEAKKHKKELVRRSSNEKLFSELSQQEQDRLCIKDIYPSDYHCFTVAGYDVLVENEAVGEALSDLPKEKREVILLAFFLGMNDGEIAACLFRQGTSNGLLSADKLTRATKGLPGGISVWQTEQSQNMICFHSPS